MWVGVGLNFSMSSHDVVPAGDSRETIMGGTLLNGGKIKELLLGMLHDTKIKQELRLLQMF